MPGATFLVSDDPSGSSLAVFSDVIETKMLSRATAAILGALILSASCTKSEGGDAFGTAPDQPTGSVARSGSSGGFSADLAKEIGSGGKPVGSAGSKKPTAAGKPGSNVAAAPGTGLKVGQAPAAAKSGSGAPAGPGAKVDTPVPGAKVETPPPAQPEVPISDPEVEMPAPKTTRAQPRGPVKVPPDLAAIKLSLLPNWDRDIDQAGTFQYVVRIKGTQSTKTFTFHYGYDDPRAPTDREQYKKFLQDSKALNGDLRDRQRGSAWFLEGSDASGLPAFRYMVLYGGKRLICYGSLYKDADANRLGDDRDQTVIQAKQICETLAL